jgi:hypothetical protein
MVFYNNQKKIYAFSPPRRRTFRGTFRENFFRSFLKKYRAKERCRKKNSCKQLGDEKKFVHRKIVQPPPQISNGPSLICRYDFFSHLSSFVTAVQNRPIIGLNTNLRTILRQVLFVCTVAKMRTEFPLLI